MPLLKIFSPAKGLAGLDCQKLQLHLCQKHLFNVPTSVLQVLHVSNTEMHPPADAYVDIRCKGKEDRTPELIQKVSEEICKTIKDQTGKSDIRVRTELYQPSLQHAFDYSKVVTK